MKKHAKSALTDHELASLAGVAESTLKLHRKAGAPMPRHRNDVAKWLPRYHEWRAIRAKRPGPAAQPPNSETSRWVAERMKWLSQGARIRVAREVGALVPRKEVIEFASKACLTVTQRLGQLVQKLGSQFGEEVQAAAQQEVDDVLASFERGLEPAMHGYSWPEGTAAAASSTTPKASTTNSTHDVATGTQPGDDDEDDSEVPGNLSGEFHNPPADEAGTTP